jgi:ferredoxin
MTGSVRRRPALRRSAHLPDIDTRRCTGCGRCVAACDLHLLSLETVRWEKSAVLHEAGLCTGCSLCALSCPFSAISMRAAATVAAIDGVSQPQAPSA